MRISNLDRRQLLRSSAIIVGGAITSPLWAADRLLTPPQMTGPFYPVPPIPQQRYSDTDLTRLTDDSAVAEGEIIRVSGSIIDTRGEPLSGSVVEIWQANHGGRYNHPRDENPAPLDLNFQYWGRMSADAEGRYSFLTIRPGKYPGRTPHIHFRIRREASPELVTQMYFDEFGELNARDGIYRRLSREQQKSVTVEFGKTTDSPDVPLGDFTIVMGPRRAAGTTPPM